ncbi:metallophosphoesterase [Nocardia yamanashiensis]|uniref:metallophosphoesterase n=1 Tax=Nocardia yamanashiensis TaxID=209247 RepID=UPI001E5F5532|nr:metallophosphoesterase [Nocardia yamanashiensis]UGT43669.1 metallophosphoesterase [Nocardia yamanashiensis]
MSDVTIVQLTDTHLRAAGEHVHGVVDSHENLLRVLAQVRVAKGPIHAIMLTGDLADNGAPEAYRRLRAAVEPVAAELGARVVYLMGNHDERVAFGETLLDLAPGSVDPLTPHDSVTEVAGLRLIGLDSTTPGRHDGWLEDEQLHWLAAELRNPATLGTVLAVHHPPLPSAIAAAETLRLRNAEALAEVIAGTDVRVILCGHNHLTGAGMLAGVPVWMGPASSYRLETMPPAGRYRARTGFGFSRLDIVDSALVMMAVETTAAQSIHDSDEAAELARLAAIMRR